MTFLRSARPAAPAVLAGLLLATLTGCGLGAELEREANPARTPAPRATTTAPPGPGDPSAPSLAPPSAAAPTACPPSGLRVTTGLVDAAMGLRATSLTLTNCGGAPYELSGYPSLTVLDDDHDRVDVEVLRGTDDISAGVGGAEEPGRFTLAPGDSAETTLAWRNTVTGSTVPAVHAPYLSVAPAPGGPAQVVALDGGLDLGDTGRLGATAWQRTEG